MTDIATLKARAEEAHTAATLAQRVYEQAIWLAQLLVVVIDGGSEEAVWP